MDSQNIAPFSHNIEHRQMTSDLDKSKTYATAVYHSVRAVLIKTVNECRKAFDFWSTILA